MQQRINNNPNDKRHKVKNNDFESRKAITQVHKAFPWKVVYYNILFSAILPTSSVAGRNIKRVVNLSEWQQVLKHKYPVRY